MQPRPPVRAVEDYVSQKCCTFVCSHVVDEEEDEYDPRYDEEAEEDDLQGDTLRHARHHLKLKQEFEANWQDERVAAPTAMRSGIIIVS